MTKDKILSAEEFLWKFIMTQTGTPETDMSSIEDMSKMPEFSRMVGMLNDYAAQFHPPAMTEEELRKEVESILGSCTCGEIYTLRKLTAPDCVWCNYSESVIELVKARKMGAIKMDRETSEKIWDACFNHMTEGQYDPEKYPDKETFLKSINQ